MTNHPTHNMHKNSLEAYAAMMAGDKRMTRQGEIYRLLTGEPPLTDKQIMTRLGYSDPNAVRPRVSDMVKEGTLVECGECEENGRTVRVVRIANDHDRKIAEQNERIDYVGRLMDTCIDLNKKENARLDQEEIKTLRLQLVQANERIRFLENKLARGEV